MIKALVTKINGLWKSEQIADKKESRRLDVTPAHLNNVLKKRMAMRILEDYDLLVRNIKHYEAFQKETIH